MATGENIQHQLQHSPIVDLDLQTDPQNRGHEPMRRLVNWNTVNYVDLYEEPDGRQRAEIFYQNGRSQQIPGAKAVTTLLRELERAAGFQAREKTMSGR